MLCLDNNLLSDYLDGKDAARRFLSQHEDEPWTISSVVFYEALMGVLHGYVDGDIETVSAAIRSSIDVLETTERTATEAVTLQRELLERGVPADHPDVLIAATAREHGATFATAEKHYWKADVREVLDVARYDPY